MKLEDEVKLSFYKEIAAVDERHGVVLVQNVDTGKVYVKKTLDHYDKEVFEAIRDSHFQGIPVIKELIEADDTLIVIEDYISGHSLDELIETKCFSEEETIKVITTLCDILEPIHSHIPPMIHRDIKGTNVILSNDGKIYLIDFDASKKVMEGRTRDTDLLGTEEYAAPEQYGFRQSDQRTDIYALGILMNKLLTGIFPSEEKYQGVLAPIITKATSLDPLNRYQNVQSLKAALNNSEEETINTADNDYTVYYQTKPASGLKETLLRLTYPIRELPGFRSGKPLIILLALIWYAFLLSFGFLGVSKNPDYTPIQNKFYDIATFFLLFLPTLYLGNYLGVRNKIPWPETSNRKIEIIRILVGLLVTCVFVILMVTVIAMIFGF